MRFRGIVRGRAWSVAAVGAAVAVLGGCAAPGDTSTDENGGCPPLARSVSTAPPTGAGPLHDVELGRIECADPVSGMTTAKVTATNKNAHRDARYYVTVEFVDSHHKVITTETAYLGGVAPNGSSWTSVYAARPAHGEGLTVRIKRVKREFFSSGPTTEPQSNLDKIVEILVRDGLVPPNTPYGSCPKSAPQKWWLGAKANCWATHPVRPSTPSTPVPALPGGTLCADGWGSGSSGRGTCSYHGGIAH
jgi:hypothetical protein